MPRSRGRALRLLDGIYRFVGGTPTSLQVWDDQITPVTDTSRIAEIGSGYAERDSGFTLAGNNLTNATSAAATIRGSFDPFDGVSFSNRNRAESWVWLMSYAVTTDIEATHTNSAAVVVFPGDREIVLYDLRADSATSITPGTGRENVLMDWATKGFGIQLPFHLVDGSIIHQATLSSNDNITQHNFILWSGPQGARPPGVA